MSDEEKESSNPLATLYGVGLLCYTAILYGPDGFWLALGKSLLWPVWLGMTIYEKIK